MWPAAASYESGSHVVTFTACIRPVVHGGCELRGDCKGLKKRVRHHSCVGTAHRVELVRPVEASVARRARRVAVCAALGVDEIHATPMALGGREPLMAARGRGWARRVPERVLTSCRIAASLPPAWLRRAGEQVADEHGPSAPPLSQRAAPKSFPEKESHARRPLKSRGRRAGPGPCSPSSVPSPRRQMPQAEQ
jgi:hypothetical protein